MKENRINHFLRTRNNPLQGEKYKIKESKMRSVKHRDFIYGFYL